MTWSVATAMWVAPPSNHSQNRPEHAAHGGDLAAVLIPREGQGVVMPEQLVCAVDQVDFQGATPEPTLANRGGGINPASIRGRDRTGLEARWLQPARSRSIRCVGSAVCGWSSGQLPDELFCFRIHVSNISLVIAKVREVRTPCVPCHFCDGPKQRVKEPQYLSNIAEQGPAE